MICSFLEAGRGRIYPTRFLTDLMNQTAGGGSLIWENENIEREARNKIRRVSV